MDDLLLALNTCPHCQRQGMLLTTSDTFGPSVGCRCCGWSDNRATLKHDTAYFDDLIRVPPVPLAFSYTENTGRRVSKYIGFV